MSKVIINDQIEVEGSFSFSTSLDSSVNPPIISINGVFTSAAGYFPEIYSLENERYLITGITVVEESYGSEEDMIAYNFKAKAYGIADKLKEVKYNNG